jgi:hypothetical protein
MSKYLFRIAMKQSKAKPEQCAFWPGLMCVNNISTDIVGRWLRMVLEPVLREHIQLGDTPLYIMP